jgi:hypothetical protein
MTRTPTDPQLLSGRLAAFVRTKGSAKLLARAIGCDVRTAENIRRGTWPGARNWSGLWDAYGVEVVDAVFPRTRPVRKPSGTRVPRKSAAHERRLL